MACLFFSFCSNFQLRTFAGIPTLFSHHLRSPCMCYSRLDSRARPKDLLLAGSGSKLSHRYVEQIFDTNLNITRQLDFYSNYEKSTLVFL